MPSLQSRFFRLVVKYMARARFGRVFRSLPKLRKMIEQTSKVQKIPAGTEILPVLAGGTAAEWVCAPGKQTNTAILYLHGGAFVAGSLATHRELAARLSAAASAKLLLLDYRLAPEYPFPAAMLDALSAYRWLQDQGYTQQQLVIGGDSAGAGLALQTLITLRDEGSSLPAAAFFMSPQTDWVRFDGQSYVTRAHIDPMNIPEMCKFTAAYYVGDNDPETPLLYPAGIDLSGLPPLCIHVGDYEILLSDAIRLADRARASGVDVELKIWPAMWHVFQTLARFVPEARQSIDEIGRFVMNHVG